MNNIIVIGGSAAGMSFAAKYKRNNPKHNILVFEKRDYISFGACGLPYFIQDQFTDKNKMIARTPSQMIDSGIDVRIGHTVSAINAEKKIVTANDIDYEYDKLVIATGASPIVPNFAEVDNEHVFTLTSLEDGEKIKEKLYSGVKHVTVIGAGFIGLEVMDAAKHLGLEVTVVERSNSIVSTQFNKDMTEIVEEHILENGIDLKLNTVVEEIISNDRVIV